MANATLNTVTRTVTTEVEVPVVTVELSEEEAKHLVALLGKLGNQSQLRKILTESFDNHGREKGTESLYRVLTKAVGRWTLAHPGGKAPQGYYPDNDVVVAPSKW